MAGYISGKTGESVDAAVELQHSHENKTALDTIPVDHIQRQENLLNRVSTIEDASSAFNVALNSHISTDDGRWQSVNKAISDLRIELKDFVVKTYAGTIPTYDYSQTQTILMGGSLVNLADQGTWSVPINGAIQAQVAGLLGAGLTVLVNDSIVWTAPVNLLIPLNSPEIQVNAGDKISYNGILGIGQTIQVDYFPNKGT